MAIKNTGLTEQGIRAEFMDAFQKSPTFYRDLSTPINSTSGKESYKWIHQLPQMREWGTGRLARGLGSESYEIENGLYELTLEVARTEIEDDQIGGIRLRINEVGDLAASFPDYLLSQLLINGGTTGYKAYDDKLFFATNHETGNSGAQSNAITSSAVSPTAPTVAELETAFQAAAQQIMSFKNDQGDHARLGATGLVVICPPSQFYKWLKVMNSSLANLETNILQGAARIVQLPNISTANIFYLLKVDKPLRPFVFQQRTEIELGSLAEGSESEFMRDTYLYGIR